MLHVWLQKDEERKRRVLDRARERFAREEKERKLEEERIRQKDEENERKRLMMEQEIAWIKQLEKERLEQLKERELKLSLSVKKAESEHVRRKIEESERIAAELEEMRKLKYEQLSKEADEILKRRNLSFYEKTVDNKTGVGKINTPPVSRKKSVNELTDENHNSKSEDQQNREVLGEQKVTSIAVENHQPDGDHKVKTYDELVAQVEDKQQEKKGSEQTTKQIHMKKRTKKPPATESSKNYLFPLVVEHLHKGVPTLSANKQ